MKPKNLSEEDKIRIIANNEQQTFDKELFENTLKHLMGAPIEKSPKLMPIHSIDEGEVYYHNNGWCEVRRSIRPLDVELGTGDRPICPVCEELNKK